MNKEKILKKATAILIKRKEALDHEQICVEAEICPECGAKLESLIIHRFWKRDLINTRCINSSHYDELEPLDIMDY